MIMQVLHCPHCQGTDIIRHGTTRQGKQRYRCQENACKGRTFRDCSRATGFIQLVHDEGMQGFVDGLRFELHATYPAQDAH
jgi:transposase-like protein